MSACVFRVFAFLTPSAATSADLLAGLQVNGKNELPKPTDKPNGSGSYVLSSLKASDEKKHYLQKAPSHDSCIFVILFCWILGEQVSKSSELYNCNLHEIVAEEYIQYVNVGTIYGGR